MDVSCRKWHFAAACIGAVYGAGSPNWWRLICDGHTVSEWHLCDVRFYHDRGCSQPPSAGLVAHYASEARVQDVDSGAPTLFNEWASACTSCQPQEPYLGAKYFEPLVVQCVYFSECIPWTGNSSSCWTLHLESGEGPSFSNVAWSFVAGWNNPGPEDALSLNTAAARASVSSQSVVGMSPPASHCGACGTTGIQPQGQLRLTFGLPIFSGAASVEIQREGLATLYIEPSNTGWFQISGVNLTITPPEALANSGGCVTIDLDGLTFIDSDGYGPGYGQRFSWCVVDFINPEMHSMDIVHAASSSAVPLDPIPTFDLSFTELIQISGSDTVVRLQPQVSTSPSAVASSVTVSLTGSNARLTTWDTYGSKSLLRVKVPDLVAYTTYSFSIGPDAVVDRAGNPWSGASFIFTTLESAGIPTTSTAGEPELSEDTAGYDSSELTVVLAIVFALVLAALVCGCLSVLFFMKRRIAQKAALEAQHNFVAYRADNVGYQAAPKPFAREPSLYSYNTSNGTAPPPAGQRLSGQPDAGSPFNAAASSRSSASTAKDGSPHPAHDLKHGATNSGASSADEYWVRHVDGKGVPYWCNYKTMETSWRPPVRTEAAHKPGASGGRPTAPSGPSRPQAAPPGEPPPAGSTFSHKAPPKATFASGGNGAGSANTGPTSTRTNAGHPSTSKASGGQQAPNSPGKVPGQVDVDDDDSPEVKRLKKETMDQLRGSMDEDLVARKKAFKVLCLKWHPDKNQHNQEVATAMFQFIQKQKAWYTKEED